MRSALQNGSFRLAALLLAVYLTACGPAPQEPDDARGAPTAGGTLVIATQNDIAGVNELVSGASSFTQEVIERMYLDLFEEQPDFTEHPPSFEPNLAESAEWSDDRLTLTVRLRDGVTWSDGVPLTAEDVRWSWQAQTSPGVAWAYAQSKESITDVEVVDDLTVRFHFSHAYATQMSDVNEGVVLPRHVWSELPFEEWPESEAWFRQHLVVSGPFRLASWRPQEEIVLELAVIHVMSAVGARAGNCQPGSRAGRLSRSTVQLRDVILGMRSRGVVYASGGRGVNTGIHGQHPASVAWCRSTSEVSTRRFAVSFCALARAWRRGHTRGTGWLESA